MLHLVGLLKSARFWQQLLRQRSPGHPLRHIRCWRTTMAQEQSLIGSMDSEMSLRRSRRSTLVQLLSSSRSSCQPRTIVSRSDGRAAFLFVTRIVRRCCCSSQQRDYLIDARAISDRFDGERIIRSVLGSGLKFVSHSDSIPNSGI